MYSALYVSRCSHCIMQRPPYCSAVTTGCTLRLPGRTHARLPGCLHARALAFRRKIKTPNCEPQPNNNNITNSPPPPRKHSAGCFTQPSHPTPPKKKPPTQMV